MSKIIHIIGNLARGGAERFVIDLCNEMSCKPEYEIILVSLCGNAKEDSFIGEIDDRVTYVSFEKKSGFSWSVLMKLTAWLKAQAPDIVHSHQNSSEYLLLYRLDRNDTIFFHTIHNLAEAECPGRMLKLFRKLFYKRNKVIPVTISGNCSKSYREYYRLRNDVVIENARPPMQMTEEREELLRKYKGAGSGFLLVHIGRISPEKNQKLLIEVVQKINETELRPCRLLLIGEVKDEKLYQRLKKQVGADDHIEFLGGKKNVGDYLSIADAFCLSSTWEGMPISLIEAMSVGCIPVCTPIGGMNEMISTGVTGFLSEDVSTAAYYDALKQALYSSDKVLIKENLKKDYEKKYTIGISACKHLKVYAIAMNLSEHKVRELYC
ncbi:glycosyltransferase [Pedobacter sp. KBW06]|uniref:glycosyltransferase n=1 Tax=Pedobacter sp. KBW06 TaxID=2153359 RepID=UPI00131538C8|nr:glycosyltransferase [Pedobacter sp. KBW06]